MNDLSQLVYRDLLHNTKTVLSAFYYHPDTTASTQTWAHDAMCTQYARAVSKLAHSDETWQFVASRACPEQIRDFRIEDMASGMEEQAPMLWSLITCLLGATRTADSAVRMDIDQEEPSSGSDSEWDSDSEYWGNEEEGSAPPTKPPQRRTKGRRALPAVIDRINLLQKTVVILSILVQNCDQKVNALQSIVGVFLHACNTPEKVVKVLSRIGISISLTSIHRAVRSLSEHSIDDIKSLGQSVLASFAYDNFELMLPTGIPTVEKPAEGLLHLTSGVLIRLDHGVTVDDLRCSRLLWERSSLNLRAPDPRPFDPYKTLEFLYTLHPDPGHSNSSLSRRGRFRVWALKKVLMEHGPTNLSALQTSLKPPESVDAIPVVKSSYTPLRTMDCNQSKVSENIAAIHEMYKQTGLGDGEDGSVDISEFVTLVHGDLGTYERVLSAKRRRSIEDTPYERLQSVVFIIGLFHLKMAAADALWRLLVGPDKARVDETSFMRLVGRLRPKESSRLVANAKFRQQHELISHVLTVLILDAWRVEVKKRTRASSLEEWASSNPSADEIDAIAESLVRDYIEGAGVDIYALEGQAASERDQIRINTMRTMHYLMLYEELCYSLNAGDIGRFETILPHWVSIFRATGKHKYGVHMLRFFHSLYFVYPERLRRAIRYNMLVNPSGKPNEFRPVDWLVELLNLYTKVIYGGKSSNYTKARIILESVLVTVYRSSHANIERNFHLRGLTSKHATKDMRETFKVVLEYLRTLCPNEYVPGRTAAYSIPNAFTRGAAIIAAEWCRRKEQGGQGAERVETLGEMLGEDAEQADGDPVNVELSVEDLSVDGLIY
ncbi:hypothetical protein BN946_scf184740.g1 [Trametes cinnabarina]|uniref:DUF6589 domain-containing protein n=1 Tax=Pycnoporus cinnabarinus TaxID=5643 RepID=A0A060SUK8_PYCCI|nr:hypothetical protein BN946_scf184740.g1 [Trametes cinnabarina]